MRFSLTRKLFFTFIIVCAIMAIGIGIANQLSFDNAFLDYLGVQEQQRLSILADNLSEEYQASEGWGKLSSSPRLWQRLLNNQFRSDTSSKSKSTNISNTDKARRTWEKEHLRASLGLQSADKKHNIAGSVASSSSIWMPIKSNSSIVGWVTREPLTIEPDQIDLHFQEQQNNASLYIILLSLVTAILASVFLSRSFLAPLYKLVDIMKELTNGNFAVRASIKTGDELEVISRSLNLLAATLQSNEMVRRTVLAEISHDLRTPLSILKGEIEAMEDGIRSITPDSLSSLKVEVNLLIRLVEDLHLLSLAEVGTLVFKKEKIDLQEILNLCCAAYKPRFAEKNIEFSFYCGGSLLNFTADSGRIAQLLNNLLENSLRYTNKGGKVILSCVKRNDSIVIDIQDSLPSVSKDRIDNLFERFYTCDESRNRTTSGSGLGLSICKSIVLGHGGSISADESPLGGLWVHITLPIS